MRTSILSTAICMSLIGMAAASDVEAAIRRTTHIPAQGLGPALQTLAREHDFQMLYRTEIVGDLRTGGAVGELSATEALTQLLGGTGLTYLYLDDKTVTIVPVSAIFTGEKVGGSGAQSTAPLSERAARTGRERASTTAEGQKSFWSRIRLAQAQEEGGSPAGAARQSGSAAEQMPARIEEIVVTAQKREERLQDVPISMSVLGGTDLDRSTARGITEALSRVPGVAALDLGGWAGTQLTVRGVTAASATFTGGSTVGYYLDSVPFGFIRMAMSPDANAYDLERVEVLRGPQGTLYGASALNGVVRVLTKDANIDAFEAKARGSVSSTEDGDPSYRADMALNAPVVEGKLGVRAVLGYQNLGGWIDKPIRDDANDAEIRSYRLKINARPTDELSIGLSAWLSRSDVGAKSVSEDGRHDPSVLEEPAFVDYDAYGLKVGYDFSRASLTSMTSYLDFSNRGALDLIGFGLANRYLNTANDSSVFAHEMILNSAHGGSWRWSLGGMYRDGDERVYQDRTDAITGALVAPYAAPSDATTLSESFAVFVELTRLFLGGRWELTGGLRYFEDEISDREHSRRSFAGGIPVPPAPALVNTNNKFDAVSPRVVLTWHPRDRSSIYTSYSEGFRSGVTQVPAVAAGAPQFPPADADTLKNYEIGIKSNLWDGRLGLDVAAFYIDWEGVQQQLTVEVAPGLPLSGMVNGGSASGAGFELSAIVQPIRNLSLGVSYSWNDLTMDQDVISGGFTLFPKGSRLNMSPETTAAATVDYSFPLGSGGFQGQFSASANYTSELGNRILLGPNLVVRTGDSILISRMTLSVASPTNWTASVFVDNLANEDGILSADLFTPAWNLRVRPRTFGVQFEYGFK